MNFFVQKKIAKFALLICFLFIFLAVSAFATVDITVDSSSNPVTFTGTCDATETVILQVLFSGATVWVGDAEVVDNVYGAEFTASKDGDYTVYVSCSDVVSEEFCYGEDCDGTDVGGSEDEDSSDDSSSSSSSSSSSGGRGSSYYSSCEEDWSCFGWSVCDSSLSQSRICSDVNSCGSEDDKPETDRSCDECEESWICGEWSECSSESQSRSCTDESSCGTYDFRPDEERSCEDGRLLDSIFGSVDDDDNDDSKTVYVQETSFMDPIYNFFVNNGLVVGLVFLALVLIIVGGIFFFKYRAEHGPAANASELNDYIKQESEAGMDKEHITKSLEKSGWTEKEINEGFSSLASSV